MFYKCFIRVVHPQTFQDNTLTHTDESCSGDDAQRHVYSYLCAVLLFSTLENYLARRSVKKRSHFGRVNRAKCNKSIVFVSNTRATWRATCVRKILTSRHACLSFHFVTNGDFGVSL